MLEQKMITARMQVVAGLQAVREDILKNSPELAETADKVLVEISNEFGLVETEICDIFGSVQDA